MIEAVQWISASIAIIMFGLIIYATINFASLKGSYGERQVNKIINKLDPDKYKVYHDLYVPTENDKTTQVDHIVTSPYGIFVIETKHFNGWIFGNERSRYWTQVIYKRKEKFFNPIWQNAGHVKALMNYLEMDKESFLSIVAFSNQSTFKFKEEFTQSKVIQFPDLQRTIKELSSEIINDDERSGINNQLNELVITDRKIKKQVSKNHVETIKTALAKKEELAVDKGKCPKCSSELVKRNGRYGSFFGCNNYPKCKYTQKLELVK